MTRKKWLFHIVLKSLAYRKGRSLLLLAVLAMASSLVTSLGIVSDSMGKRVAEEIRRYGANLVIIPEEARLDIGSGGLNFGGIAEPAYLSQDSVLALLAAHREAIAGHSLHLKGYLKNGALDLPAEGVNFAEIRSLFPWWQLRGSWPADGEAVVGTDLAARFSLKAGDMVKLAGAAAGVTVRVAGVVSTGGDEDKELFLPLETMQRALGLERQVSQVRLLAKTGKEPLEKVAAALQGEMRGASVREVRQVARTSESLLKKVQLLMLLVTAVVLVASASSVASTMSTTVLERGREIGLMKAIGGTRRDVVLIFSIEAACFGFLGGVAGFLAGNGIAGLVTRTVFAAPAEFLPLFIPVAIAVSLLLALAGSLGPMVSIFNLDPVSSLRGE